MDYLKFNCSDLTTLNLELSNIYRKLQHLSNELADIYNTLDPHIKSYEGIQKQFTLFQTGIANIVVQIMTSYNDLDQIIDIYYAAEKNVLQAAVSLTTGVSFKKDNKIISSMPKTETSSINSSDLILEDWLAELIYKSNSK